MIKIEKLIRQSVVPGRCYIMRSSRLAAWLCNVSDFLNLVPVLMRKNCLPAFMMKDRNGPNSAAPGAGRRFKSCRPDLFNLQVWLNVSLGGIFKVSGGFINIRLVLFKGK